jgi:heat-inducible transcriptional repressor
MTELSFRARRILYAAVTEYIATGEPVGSRKLARRYGLDVSPATIRNELADLEDSGYLAQPHTSAGRVPTDRGFRAFVDALVRVREVEPSHRAALLARLGPLTPGVDDVAREAGRILSSLTGVAAVVQAPRADDQHVAQLRWMRFKPGQLLAVVITRSGAVENRVVSMDDEPSAGELESLHNYVESLLGERSLLDLRELVARAADTERSELVRRARDVVEATVSAASDERAVLIEGQTRLLGQPDFANVDKMRGVLGALEEKERLLELLDRTMAAGGVQVLIGAEVQLIESQDLTVIAAPYGSPGAGSGTLGLIAPTRIDYQKVVPLVGCAASMVSDLLDKRH